MHRLLKLLRVFLLGVSCGASAAYTVSPPLITFVAPQHEARYIAPAAPVFYVTASPSYGDPTVVPPTSIAYVDFLDGENVIGTVTATNSESVHGPAAFAFVWLNPPQGMHKIHARVTDTAGYSATTIDQAKGLLPILVSIVGAISPPEVHLTAPATGQIFTSAGVVPLVATAISPQAAIRRVEFVAGNTVVAAVSSPPYSAQWQNPPVGDFTVVAKAYDYRGIVAASGAAYVRVLAARAPSVVVTAPSPGATIPLGTPLTIAADAIAPDSSIGRVDFYAGTSLVGSVAAPPFTYSLATPQAGVLSLTGKAYDLQGASGTSMPVVVTVTNDAVPVVSLTAPSAGATYLAPATISLSANASEPGGSIAKVEFLANGTVVGLATTLPFSSIWFGVPPGSYAVAAKATDNLGKSTISSSINVIVLNNASPTVALTAPQTGTQFAQGQPIVLTASAATPTRTIDRVEFYSDTLRIGTVSISGAGAATTATLTWTGAGVGTHALTAKVFATDGTNATSVGVNIIVGNLSVTLTEPFSGQAYQSPADIRISANPAGSAGTVVGVDFFGDGLLLGTATAAPYTTLWSGVAVGSHVITATTRDSIGLSASAAAVTISVITAGTLQVDSSLDGASINDDNITISGTALAPSNAAVIVNGSAAALDQNGYFFANNVQLFPGANTVTLLLNTLDGAPVTRTIALNSTGASPFTVTLDKQEGLAPFTTNVTISNRANVAFQRIELDVNDDGTPEQIVTALTGGKTVQAATYNSPGIYTLRVTVYDSSDAIIYVARRKIRVYLPAELGLKVVNVYKNMVNRLIANNPASALRCFTGDTQANYAQVFDTLGPALPTVASQLGTLIDGVVSESSTELTIVRDTPTGAQAFMIHLIRGGDGIWRIESL